MEKELKSELEQQGSFLGKLPKRFIGDSSNLPQDYFDKMEDRFFHALQENKPKASSVSIWDRHKYSMPLAAILSFAVLGFGIIYMLNSSSDMKLSQNELQTYFASEEELEDVSLCDALCSQSHKHILDKISNEEIKNYFLETEGIDISKI
jgi:hypothetical protein